MFQPGPDRSEEQQPADGSQEGFGALRLPPVEPARGKSEDVQPDRSYLKTIGRTLTELGKAAVDQSRAKAVLSELRVQEQARMTPVMAEFGCWFAAGVAAAVVNAQLQLPLDGLLAFSIPMVVGLGRFFYSLAKHVRPVGIQIGPAEREYYKFSKRQRTLTQSFQSRFEELRGLAADWAEPASEQSSTVVLSQALALAAPHMPQLACGSVAGRIVEFEERLGRMRVPWGGAQRREIDQRVLTYVQCRNALLLELGDFFSDSGRSSDGVSQLLAEVVGCISDSEDSFGWK